MCEHACVCMCCLSVCVSMRVSVRVFVHMRVFVSVCVRVYASMCVCVCVFANISLFECGCMHACLYQCMFVWCDAGRHARGRSNGLLEPESFRHSQARVRGTGAECMGLHVIYISKVSFYKCSNLLYGAENDAPKYLALMLSHLYLLQSHFYLCFNI